MFLRKSLKISIGLVIGLFMFAAIGAQEASAQAYYYYSSITPGINQIAGFYGSSSTYPYGQPQAPAPSAVYYPSPTPPAVAPGYSYNYGYPQNSYSYPQQMPASGYQQPASYQYQQPPVTNVNTVNIQPQTVQPAPVQTYNEPVKPSIYQSFVSGCQRVYSNVRHVVVTIFE